MSLTIRRRILTSAACAVALAGATAASAQAVVVADDTQAEFNLGTNVRTAVTPTGGGAVELGRPIDTDFGGTELPAGWTFAPWTLPDGSATVSGGAVAVDGASLNTGVIAGPRSSLSFTATFGTQPFTHAGFVGDYDNGPWAMFSTGSDGGGKLYARTKTSGGEVDTLLADSATTQHDFRIDQTENGYAFYVDGNLRPTLAAAGSDLQVRASNYASGGGALSIESLRLANLDGIYTSRVLDAGDDRVTGVSFAADATKPTGTEVTYEVRTGPSSTPGGDWSAWAPVTAGAVPPPNRYAQYRATLTSTSADTPVLKSVALDFTVDNQAPTITLDATLTGTTARATFSSDDPGAVLECSLDGATYASCTSPAEFNGLSVGSHTIAVRATDTFGNAATASRTVTVPGPGGGTTGGGTTGGGTTGGGDTSGGGTTVVDRTAPRVVIGLRSVRPSRRGYVSLPVRCLGNESRCLVTIQVKRGTRASAWKTLTLSGNQRRVAYLRLTSATRAQIARRGKLSLILVITARDAAGNAATTTQRIMAQKAKR